MGFSLQFRCHENTVYETIGSDHGCSYIKNKLKLGVDLNYLLF